MNQTEQLQEDFLLRCKDFEKLAGINRTFID
jgi:hypothetical protein